MPRSEQPAHRREQAHRHDQDHRERQRPALILRREQQEHEHHRGGEHVDGGVARRLLLIGELGPLIGVAVGQELLGELLHRLKPVAGRKAGLGAALHRGRREQVEMLDAIGPGDVAERGDRAERHHLALGVARLELTDGVQVLAEVAVGLRRDPVGAA